jgi:uncharacterized protein DUF5670
MLWRIALALAVVWGLALLTNHTLGGLVHLLMVLALGLVVLTLYQARRLASE